mmetsp:Transcript_79294/g.250492  ORF Transcript_79294/g.250492 Transcript_79294/m.250492 type:complete len:134 (-) Transcript_79294:159-560(-)
MTTEANKAGGDGQVRLPAADLRRGDRIRTFAGDREAEGQVQTADALEVQTPVFRLQFEDPESTVQALAPRADLASAAAAAGSGSEDDLAGRPAPGWERHRSAASDRLFRRSATAGEMALSLRGGRGGESRRWS